MYKISLFLDGKKIDSFFLPGSEDEFVEQFSEKAGLSLLTMKSPRANVFFQFAQASAVIVARKHVKIYAYSPGVTIATNHYNR